MVYNYVFRIHFQILFGAQLHISIHKIGQIRRCNTLADFINSNLEKV
jgi:hypothetical protein